MNIVKVNCHVQNSMPHMITPCQINPAEVVLFSLSIRLSRESGLFASSFQTETLNAVAFHT
jgi:hypothetical protein